MKKITDIHSLAIDTSADNTYITVVSLMDFILKATDAGANHLRIDIDKFPHDADINSIELIAVEIREETPEEEKARHLASQEQGEKYRLIAKRERERQYLELKKEFDPPRNY